MPIRRFAAAAALVAALSPSVVLAQAAAPAQHYSYPRAGQSQEVQQRDRFECHQWGVQQSGFDPDLALQMHDPPFPQQHQGGGPNAAKGAAMGAVMGSPARGAAIGAIRHAFHEVREEEAQKKKAEAMQQMQKKEMALAANYQRAYKACMEARNYTVE